MARSRKRTQAGLGDFAPWAEAAPARPFINRDQIVRQALALLDDVGFDGLTMRRLAERLGVQAASLYNHVRDKNELLALVADAICGEVPDLDPRRSWREQLETMAWDYRRVLMAHRDAARVLAATPPVGPSRLWIIEQVLAALRGAGFSDDEMVDAAWVGNTYVVGCVLDETLGVPVAEGAEAAADEVRAQLKQWFKALPPERYATLIALADHLVDASSERRFGFGLTALLDGLEHRLASRRAT